MSGKGHGSNVMDIVQALLGSANHPILEEKISDAIPI